jgi:hypothetical protein
VPSGTESLETVDELPELVGPEPSVASVDPVGGRVVVDALVDVALADATEVVTAAAFAPGEGTVVEGDGPAAAS